MGDSLQKAVLMSLRGHELDNHPDDPRATGAHAQIHAGILDFILQQLVQLTAQLFHQLGHLTHVVKHRGKGKAHLQRSSAALPGQSLLFLTW